MKQNYFKYIYYIMSVCAPKATFSNFWKNGKKYCPTEITFNESMILKNLFNEDLR